ncbi:hypothetical protein GCM10027176_13510 [Actinoallomurus bryophytorum]
MASSGIESFSDKLRQRADTLRGPGTTKGTEPGEGEGPEAPARRKDSARRERPRVPEREETSDAYDDEDEGDEYERGEPESERGYREERRPPPRPTRSEPRRRAPRQ